MNLSSFGGVDNDSMH